MAKAPAKKPGTDVVNWEEQMAADAQVASESQRQSGGGGKFISLKAGVLSYDGSPMPGNRMAVILIADTMENSFYDTAYDPDTPTSPKCFAFAKNEDDLEPHEAVDKDPYFERQHEQCAGCPNNEWGSARTGRGKACSNVMRVGMVIAGTYVNKGTARAPDWELELLDEPEHFAKSEAAFMKVSVMNVRHYSTYVKSLASDLKRPPHGVFTDIYVEPDPKSQFRIGYEVIDKVPNELLGIIMPRHKVEQAGIAFPYTPPMAADEAAAPQRASNKLAKKPAPKKR